MFDVVVGFGSLSGLSEEASASFEKMILPVAGSLVASIAFLFSTELRESAG